jgi:hypothetical protein
MKIADEEYAVLCEIRNNKSTAYDRLKTLFFSQTDNALNNLEAYDLIRSDISGGRWYYYATAAGQNYQHITENQRQTSSIEVSKPKNLIEKIKKLKPIYKVFTAIGTLIVGIATLISTILAILQYFK